MIDSRHAFRRLRAAAVAATLLRGGVALAAGDATGRVGPRGTVTGDISRTAGETDRITIDLASGATLLVSFRATFSATLALSDPDGVPVPIALTGGSRGRASVAIARGGTYEVAVASSDGTQGLYRLGLKQTWPRAVPVSGSGSATLDFGMPAGGKMSCVLSPAAGASGPPQITHLVDPGGLEMLPAPVVGGRVIKLPPTTASVEGMYHLTIDADATGAWTGRLLRRVPRVAPETLKLANGLDTVSFRSDGVGAVFSRRCASCHGWAASYGGVRQYARAAVGRMATGVMPPGGGVSSAEVALVKTWIATGMRP
jgi:mono/diheme cytochrome c family protein